MKFKEAMNAAWDEEDKRLAKAGLGQKFALTKETTKILAFLWNMIAIAGNKLDDLAYLDKNLDVQSIPLPDKKKSDAKDKTLKGTANDSGSENS